MGFIENKESQGGEDSYDSREAHAFELDGAQDDGSTGEAGNHGHRSEDQISRLGIVYLLFDEHADTRRSDEAEEEDADAAHDGSRDGVDEGCDFSDEGEKDSEDSGTADDPSTIDASHGHDAHVFAVGSIRCRTDAAGNHIGEAISEEGPMEAGVLDQISTDDITGDEEMADVFCQHHEESRENHHDRRGIEVRRIKSREGEPRHFFHMGEIDDAHENGEDVARDDTD